MTSDNAEERWQCADTMQSIRRRLRLVWMFVESSWQLRTECCADVLYFTSCRQQPRILQHLRRVVNFLCWQLELHTRVNNLLLFMICHLLSTMFCIGAHTCCSSCCHATCMHSTDYAVARCLSQCPSVTWWYSVDTTNISSKFFYHQVSPPF